jgi:aryl sulfotransferase
MLTYTDEQIFGQLEAQRHRRFVKTHSPLDGIPRVEGVTYIAVIRHPLDIALSDLDHADNMREDVAVQLRTAASGEPEQEIDRGERPQDPAGYLRWFIDNHEEPCGSGPYGLEDYCQQALTYWDARDDPQVHLFHYADLWNDLDGQMRRVADALGVPVDESHWPEFVEAATLNSMRSRATQTAPNVHQGIWVEPERFFRVGGTRDWASQLTSDDLAHFEQRMVELAGDAAPWMLGRSPFG